VERVSLPETWHLTLDELLEVLPDEYRQLIYLKHDQGMSCKEIAEVLGKPIGTITGWLSRAYGMLREKDQKGPKDMIECRKVKGLSYLFVSRDPSLSSELYREIDLHQQGCTACAGILKDAQHFVSELDQAFKEKRERRPDVKTRIQQAVRACDRGSGRNQTRRLFWLSAAAGILFLLLLTLYRITQPI
jgi:hypothetical protein